MTYTVDQITVLIGAHRYGERNASISFLLTDSRSLCFPEETLFFALRSARNDGHKYIGELYRRGVRNFVIEVLPDGNRLVRFYYKGIWEEVLDSLEAINNNAQKQSDIIEKLSNIDEEMVTISSEFMQFLNSHAEKISELNNLSNDIKSSVQDKS